MTRSTDILIIGGGMAGLTCALEIPRNYRVTILSKTALPTGSTFLAQGGMAAVTSPTAFRSTWKTRKRLEPEWLTRQLPGK